MEKLCTECGHVGISERLKKGSFILELILWVAFIVPGIIYSIWRLKNRHHACARCGSTNVIPPVPSPTQTYVIVPQAVPPPPPPMAPAELQYRIAKDGKDLGELSVATIQEMLNTGQLTGQDYYFDASSNQWIALATIGNNRPA